MFNKRYYCDMQEVQALRAVYMAGGEQIVQGQVFTPCHIDSMLFLHVTPMTLVNAIQTNCFLQLQLRLHSL